MIYIWWLRFSARRILTVDPSKFFLCMWTCANDPTKTMHVPRNPQYNMHICDMGGGRVGWGGAITFISSGTRMECMLCSQGGDWWGGVRQKRSCQLEHVWTGIFSCTFTHTSCYALGSSFALAHKHTHVMLRSGIFPCTFTHTSCYALGSSLALAHTRHATLWDLLLHLHTHVMLRSGIFPCTCTHTSCYALGYSLALAHTRHATLWDLLLHLHTHVMLRSGIFSCTCTHTSCYALGSSLALAHTRHATLWDLLLHSHTHVMLRSGIFSCTCTHTSCYALRSSFALAIHEISSPDVEI